MNFPVISSVIYVATNIAGYSLWKLLWLQAYARIQGRSKEKHVIAAKSMHPCVPRQNNKAAMVGLKWCTQICALPAVPKPRITHLESAALDRKHVLVYTQLSARDSHLIESMSKSEFIWSDFCFRYDVYDGFL